MLSGGNDSVGLVPESVAAVKLVPIVCGASGWVMRESGETARRPSPVAAKSGDSGFSGRSRRSRFCLPSLFFSALRMMRGLVRSFCAWRAARSETLSRMPTAPVEVADSTGASAPGCAWAPGTETRTARANAAARRSGGFDDMTAPEEMGRGVLPGVQAAHPKRSDAAVGPGA
jgi:hypothetical protein